jgi:hypothetical protein
MSSHDYERRKVFLLHGLARTSRSMRPIDKFLKREGFSVFNLNYPSRKKPIEELSKFVREQIQSNEEKGIKLDFVTHSMGGIILRYIMKVDPLPNLGRVVMLGPPNQGSEVVDRLSKLKIFKLMGPASLQLGTSSDGFVNTLGKVDFDLGIIAGNGSINPFLSFLIPGPDDGKVSVERAKVKGMNDFLVVPCSHSFFMSNLKVQKEILFYFKNGNFLI